MVCQAAWSRAIKNYAAVRGSMFGRFSLCLGWFDRLADVLVSQGDSTRLAGLVSLLMSLRYIPLHSTAPPLHSTALRHLAVPRRAQALLITLLASEVNSPLQHQPVALFARTLLWREDFVARASSP
jgi:hypothetical protein